MKIIKQIVFYTFFLVFATNASAQEPQITIADVLHPNSYSELNSDTLYLKAGKEYMLFIDISYQSRNAGQNSNRFLTREWKEVEKHYPHIECRRIDMHQTIVIKNNKKETLELNNPDNEYSKYVYWNGKPKSATISGNNFVDVTEIVAKVKGERKVSSYAAEYASDLTRIEEIKKTFKPSKNVIANFKSYPQYNADTREMLPYNYINIEGVKEIKMTTENIKTLSILFNKDETLNSCIIFDKGSKGTVSDSISYNYREGILSRSTEMSGFTTDFRYNNDTVYQITKNHISKYVLYGNTFVQSGIIRMDKENINLKDIETVSYPILKKENGELCVRINNTYSMCYSDINNPIESAVNIEEYKQNRISKILDNGNLEIASGNRKLVFYFDNKKLQKVDYNRGERSTSFDVEYVYY